MHIFICTYLHNLYAMKCTLMLLKVIFIIMDKFISLFVIIVLMINLKYCMSFDRIFDAVRCCLNNVVVINRVQIYNRFFVCVCELRINCIMTFTVFITNEN